MAFTSNPRANVVAGVAGLVAAYVRNIAQYHRYSWDSTEVFLVSWLIHYVAIILCAGIACLVAQSGLSARLGASENLRKLPLEDAVILAALFVLVVSVLMFIGAHAQLENE